MDQMAIAYLNKGGFELLQNLFMKYTGGFDDPKIKSAVKKKLEVLFKLCTPGSGEYIRGAHELMQAVDWLNDLISRIERPFDNCLCSTVSSFAWTHLLRAALAKTAGTRHRVRWHTSVACRPMTESPT